MSTSEQAFSVPAALRNARLIPQARAGERPYLMVKHPITGALVSTKKLADEQGAWKWTPEGDAYVSRYGAQLTGDPDSDHDLYLLDLDVPILPGGAVVADGMRTLADLAIIDEGILDTSAWLMVRTPGHSTGSLKGPGWHCWFRWPKSDPLKVGAMPGHREIELKRTGTAPGSPGYVAVRGTSIEELPSLPAWVAARFGKAEPGRASTSEAGWSAPQWQVEWAKRVSTGAAPLVAGSPIRARDNSTPPSLMGLEGEERLRRFDEVTRLTSDLHYLAMDFLGHEGTRDKLTQLLYPKLRLGWLRHDDPVFRQFTADELRYISATQPCISRVGELVEALDFVPTRETDVVPDGEEEGSHNIPAEVASAAIVRVLVLAQEAGIGVSSPMVARAINFNHEMFGLVPGYHRWLMPSRVRQLLAELREDGAITQDIKGHAYLHNRRRGYCPAVWVVRDAERVVALAELEAKVNTNRNGPISVNFRLTDVSTPGELAARLFEGCTRPSHMRFWTYVRRGRRLAEERITSRRRLTAA